MLEAFASVGVRIFENSHSDNEATKNEINEGLDKNLRTEMRSRKGLYRAHERIDGDGTEDPTSRTLCQSSLVSEVVGRIAI